MRAIIIGGWRIKKSDVKKIKDVIAENENAIITRVNNQCFAGIEVGEVTPEHPVDWVPTLDNDDLEILRAIKNITKSDDPPIYYLIFQDE